MTAAELIRSSLRLLGVLAAGETPKASEEADALAALNGLLDSWSTERLLVYTQERAPFTLTANVATQSIGTGGSLPGGYARPTRIDRASIIPAGATEETPVTIASDAEWQAAAGKTTYGTPHTLWWEGTHPALDIHFLPIPSAAHTLVLYWQGQLQQVDDANSDVDFPPGYSRALRYNLARELAPEYGVQLAGEAMAIADESKETLKRLNARPSYLRADAAVLAGGFNLFTGDG